MDRVNKGIIVSYSFSTDYFKVGAAYQIHLGTNVYKTAVLVNCSDTELQFKTFDKKGTEEELTLSIDDIQYDRYEIKKMKIDYENGSMTE
jgi:hypothetical protein